MNTRRNAHAAIASMEPERMTLTRPTHPTPPATVNRRTRRGFSLIELLLVLVILAVLAAVVAPRFAQRGEQARETAARTDIATLENALDTFEVDNGRYPTTEQGLNALLQQPSGLADSWRGPYLRRSDLPRDPWGNPYVYRYPGQQNQHGFDLYSRGADGQDGTEDDITNW